MTETQAAWLIKGAMVAGGGAGVTDLLLAGGTIAAIGPGLDDAGAQVLDAAGLIALPGLVDLHTHLREPGREDAERWRPGPPRRRWAATPPSMPWPTPSPWPTPPGWSSRSGAWAGRPAIATSSRSARSPRGWPGPGSPSSAPWPTRPPGSACSPMTAGAWPTRC